MANATATTPASAYTARRPESTSSRRPVRAPYSDAPMPYTASASARISAKRPAISTGSPSRRALGLELRRALGDERVLLAHEAGALLAHVDDDLPALLEGVRHGADVGDRHRVAALAILHAELVREAVGPALPRAGRDLARQLVG